MWRALACLVALLAIPGAVAADHPVCLPDSELAYVCATAKPEDLIALPETDMRLDEPACGGLRKVVNGVADPILAIAALPMPGRTYQFLPNAHQLHTGIGSAGVSRSCSYLSQRSWREGGVNVCLMGAMPIQTLKLNPFD